MNFDFLSNLKMVLVNVDQYQILHFLSSMLPDLRKSSHPIVRCCSVVAVSHASLHAVDMGLSDMHTTKNKSYVKGGTMLVGLVVCTTSISFLYFQYAGSKTLPLNYTSMAESFYSQSLSSLSAWSRGLNPEVSAAAAKDLFSSFRPSSSSSSSRVSALLQQKLQSRLLESLLVFLRFYYFAMFASSSTSGWTQENSENLSDFQPDSTIRGHFWAKIDFGSGKAGGIARRQESYHNKI